MKLKKLLALSLALVSVMMIFTGCALGKTPDESTPEVTMPIISTYSATAHLKIVDINGDVIYSTEEEDEEMYQFTSSWSEPTVLNFFDDYCYMNDNKLSYKAKDNVLKTITLISKKGNVDYKADAKYQINETDSATTFWLCFINGKEIEGQLDNTMVKDGDEVVLRLTYIGQDLSETTPPPYVETNPTEEEQ